MWFIYLTHSKTDFTCYTMSVSYVEGRGQSWGGVIQVPSTFNFFLFINFEARSFTGPEFSCRLGWLASKLRGSDCLCLHSASITSVPPHPLDLPLTLWVLGLDFMFLKQTLYRVSYLSSLKYSFWLPSFQRKDAWGASRVDDRCQLPPPPCLAFFPILC